MTDSANIIKRYFAGQVMYWTGIGWSNVSARAKRFSSLFAATYIASKLAESYAGTETDSIVCGSNMCRVFRTAG